jgi:predicted lipoprotein with Yx(FWY)xxD motif
MTKRTILICATALTLVFAACGKDDKTDAASSKTTRPAVAAKLAVDSRTVDAFGKVLTDADGRTLYVFDKDAPTKPKSACTGPCATNWPPLLTTDGAGVGEGLDAGMLGQSARDDGTTQFTYNGWPLYRFSGDTAAGDTHGQGVGGVWHIAGADGNPVVTGATTTTPASPAARNTATTARKTTATTATRATSPPATSPPTTSSPTTYGSPY